MATYFQMGKPLSVSEHRVGRIGLVPFTFVREMAVVCVVSLNWVPVEAGEALPGGWGWVDAAGCQEMFKKGLCGRSYFWLWKASVFLSLRCCWLWDREGLVVGEFGSQVHHHLRVGFSSVQSPQRLGCACFRFSLLKCNLVFFCCNFKTKICSLWRTCEMKEKSCNENQSPTLGGPCPHPLNPGTPWHHLSCT